MKRPQILLLVRSWGLRKFQRVVDWKCPPGGTRQNPQPLGAVTVNTVPQPSTPASYSIRASVKKHVRIKRPLAERLRRAAEEEEMTEREFIRRVLEKALPRAA